MADVVASSSVFASTDGLREIWDVTSEVAAGTALINGDRAGVAYTPSGGYTGSETVGAATISGIPQGGASLPALKASVATDGTWEFPVTGVTGSTKNGTKVYAVVASGKVTGLTLTAGSNTLFGVINNRLGYVSPVATYAGVKIGVL